MSPTELQRKRTVKPNRPGLRQFLLLFLMVGGLAASCIGVFVWWQEAALRDARQYLANDNPSSALKAIDGYLRDNPQHDQAMSLRARTLVALGQPLQAVELFERVGFSTNEELHAWAQALLRLERWSAALPLLEHLRQTGTDYSDVIHELAACRAKVGDIDGAINAAIEFSQLPGCSVRGNLLVGTLHNKRGNLRQASVAWADVLKESPDAEGLQVPPAEFFLEYGRVLRGVGSANLAAEYLERSLKLEAYAGGFVTLGEAYSDLGEKESATNAFNKALEMDANATGARLGLAQLAISRGQPNEALEWLAPLEAPDKLTSQVAFLLQQASTRLGDLEAASKWRETADKLRNSEHARETAMQVLRDVPESSWGQVLRAYQFAESGNWTEAELIMRPIAASVKDHPFIQELFKAIQQRSSLPSLEGLPIQKR